MDAGDSDDLGILITNIKGENTESDVRQFFGKFGNITYVKIIPDKFNEGSNICYMKYDTVESAKKAVEEADKTNALNSSIRVSIKKILTKYNSERGGRNNEDRPPRSFDERPRRPRDSPGKDSIVSRQPSQITSGRGRGAFRPENKSPGSMREVTIPNIDIPLNTMVAVELIELIDTNNILARPLQQTEQSKPEIDQIVNKYNENTSPLRKLHNPQVGSFCLAKWHEDERYYRARVIEVKSEGCVVAFIDEGNAGELSRDIIEMPDDLSSYPAQFLNCKLNCNSSDEFIATILEEVAEKQVYIHAIQKSVGIEPIVVNMFLADKDSIDLYKVKSRKDVRKTSFMSVCDLKTFKAGHEIKNFILLETPKSQNDSFKLVISDCVDNKPSLKQLTSLPISQDIVLYQQAADFVYRAEVLTYDVIKSRVNYSLRLIDENRTLDHVSVDQIMEPIDNKILEPARIIKCILNGNGKLTEKGTVRITSLDVSSGVYTIEFIPEFEVPQLIPNSPATKCKKGYISHVENANEFYIQFTAIEEDLGLLEEKLMSYSGSRLHNISVGTMVVAPFEGILYRAIVKNNMGSKVLVHFVDYGNSDEVSSNDVMECTAALQGLPYLATKCKLSLLIKKDKMDTVKQMLLDYSDNMPLDINVDGQDGNCLQVHLTLEGKSPLNDLVKSEGCVEESRPVQFITPTKQNGHPSPVKKASECVPRKKYESMSDVELKQRLFELEDRIVKLERLMKA